MRNPETDARKSSAVSRWAVPLTRAWRLWRHGSARSGRSRRARSAGGVPGSGYAAFISYSHAVDGMLAPALQSALHRFAKPWYRLRAVRVFRDEASLSANPGLWSSIEAALGASQYFILLASPEAARSRWVAQEASYWCRHKRSANLLIVLTDGELVWNSAVNDFDWARTTALPAVLRGMFSEEPRFIDLRWARVEQHLSLAHPRFRDCIADLAAPLHGRAKDELVGEDVRQHRRTRRIIRIVLTALATLTTVSVLASVIAVSQRNEAREQARLATSRELAATSVASQRSGLDLSLLLAVKAHQVSPTPQARGGLLSAVFASPHLVGYQRERAPVTELALSRDGRWLANADSDGTVVVTRRTSGERRTLLVDPKRRATALAFSADGAQLAVGDGRGGLRVYSVATGRQRADIVDSMLSASRVLAIALGPAPARMMAWEDENGRLSVWDGVTGNGPRRIETGQVGAAALAFSPDGRQLSTGDYDGSVMRWRVPQLARMAAPSPNRGFAGPFSLAYSPSLSHVAVGNRDGNVTLSDTRSGAELAFLGPGTPGLLDAMAAAADGRRIATSLNGVITIWDALHEAPVTDPMMGLPGRTEAVVMDAAGDTVVAAADTTIAIWDLRQQSRVSRVLGMPRRSLTDVSRFGAVATGGLGRYIYWFNDNVLSRWDRSTGRLAVTDETGCCSLAADPSGSRIAVGGSDRVFVYDAALSEPAREFRVADDPDSSFHLMMPDQKTVIAYDPSRGVLARVDLAAGAVHTASAERQPESSSIVSSRDGRHLAVALPDGGVRICAWTDARLRCSTLTGSGTLASAVSYSATGRLLVVSRYDGKLDLWNVAAGTLVRSIGVGRQSLVTMDDTSGVIALLAENGQVSLWDAHSVRPLASFRLEEPMSDKYGDIGYKSGLLVVGPGPDLFAVTPGGFAYQFRLDPDVLLEAACALAGRDLSEQERDIYLSPNERAGTTCARGKG
jgi:WD40 repeat protein